MPTRTVYVRVDDIPTWEAFTDSCTEDGVTVSERIADCLRRYNAARDKDDTRRVMMLAKVLVASGLYTQERAEYTARELLKESK